MRLARWPSIVAVAFLAASCGGSSSPAGPGAHADGNSGDSPGEVAAPDPPTDSATEASGGGDVPAVSDGPAPADVPGNGDVAGDLGDAMVMCTPTGACNPFSTNACPAGQVCGPSGTAAGNTCLNVVGATKNEGESCGGALGTCAMGLFCVSDGVASTCRRICPKGSRGMCGADKSCAGLSTDACILLCIAREVPCDIYTQSCANAADNCGLTSDRETGQRYTGCVVVGAMDEGQTCTGQLNCKKGLICIRSPGAVSAICTRVCKPNGTPACVTGQVCTGLSQNWNVTYCEAPRDGGTG